jgi:hypothetical protein
MVSNLTLEEIVTPDNSAEDEIENNNFRYSGSRPRSEVASAADDARRVVPVVAVVNIIARFEFGGR